MLNYSFVPSFLSTRLFLFWSEGKMKGDNKRLEKIRSRGKQACYIAFCSNWGLIMEEGASRSDALAKVG